jgi:hypothetical protein
MNSQVYRSSNGTKEDTVLMFANLTEHENRALFAQLGGAGHAIDKLATALMGCQQHAGAFVTYIDMWGEVNAIRGELNDQRPPAGPDAIGQRIAELFAAAANAANCDLDYAPGTITPAQQRAIMAALAECNRPVRMARIEQIIGHPVASTNDLSYVEAQKVLAAVQSERAR